MAEHCSFKRILLIDDEPHDRLVVQTCLETLGGWEVVVASSALEGLALVEVTPLDAILLDVMMPRMNGVSVLQELQDKPTTQAIPVIFLTARVSFTEPQRYLALGAKGAIAKPFDPLALVSQICCILGWD